MKISFNKNFTNIFKVIHLLSFLDENSNKEKDENWGFKDKNTKINNQEESE